MTSDTPVILHVDDEEDCLAITKIALETIGGLEVMQCNSGRRAIELAKARAPDLVLLDVMMAEIDGVETLQRLREIPGMDKIPVIFMTAKVMPEDVASLLDSGAESVIKKPFDATTVASDIIDIWRKAFQERMSSEIRSN